MNICRYIWFLWERSLVKYLKLHIGAACLEQEEGMLPWMVAQAIMHASACHKSLYVLSLLLEICYTKIYKGAHMCTDSGDEKKRCDHDRLHSSCAYFCMTQILHLFLHLLEIYCAQIANGTHGCTVVTFCLCWLRYDYDTTWSERSCGAADWSTLCDYLFMLTSCWLKPNTSSSSIRVLTNS